MKNHISTMGMITVLLLSTHLTREGTQALALQQKDRFNEDAARLQNEQNTTQIVNTYQDGVVYVSIWNTQENPFGPGSPYLAQYAAPTLSTEPQQVGVGSGFLIDQDGYILTNHHVVEGSKTIRVRFHRTDQQYDARVVGTAPDYDLALLKVDNLPQNQYVPMKLGNSDQTVVGQKAIAMGAPFDLEFTVTEGIVSAVGRVIPTGQRGIPQKALQTDAAINPGNSGGPLLNSRGEVIGINTQILSPSGNQNAGIGFAIPINVARSILPQLKMGRTVTGPQLGLTGVGIGNSVLSTRPDIRERFSLPEEGVLVQQVQSGSPAARAGIKGGTQAYRTPDREHPVMSLDGDVITRVNGKPVSSVAEVASVLFSQQAGDVVKLEILRGGQKKTVQVTLTPTTQPG